VKIQKKRKRKEGLFINRERKTTNAQDAGISCQKLIPRRCALNV
jgi:hypothetical protein